MGSIILNILFVPVHLLFLLYLGFIGRDVLVSQFRMLKLHVLGE